MRYGSLFTGIGGIDLGLERAGMECAWQVENDPYCIKILEKHWPNTRRYEDVRSVTSPEPVDLLAGGFPCQPHSVAGKRRGAEDDRNLWPEYLRLIRETRPRYIIAENVPGIVSTYIDTVLSDLEGEGYACWTFNIPACAFDAPHRRERIFIVAHTEGGDGGGGVRELAQPDGRLLRPQEQHQDETGQPCCGGEDVANAGCQPTRAEGDGVSRADGAQCGEKEKRPTARNRPADRSEDVANAEGFGVEGHGAGGEQEPRAHGQTRLPVRESKRRKSTHWTTEPGVGRVAHGVPKRIHRLRGLGNAVVPQVAEWIGERIMEHTFLDDRTGVTGIDGRGRKTSRPYAGSTPATSTDLQHDIEREDAIIRDMELADLEVENYSAWAAFYGAPMPGTLPGAG